MEGIIKSKLKEIEQECDVKILYACESGSRAWGFASPDSDYDVRFVYVHRNDHYLSIDEQRDVIEIPINDLLDINGWELRKALRLFRKSNAPLYEWLQSPIIYQSDASFEKEMKSIMNKYFSSRAMMHHYLSMTKNVVENDLSGSEVKLKKYFYALRPILASLWIADNHTVPPMEFSKLRTLLDDHLNTVVDDLLTRKSQVGEKFMITPITHIDQWIDVKVTYCENHIPELSTPGDSEVLSRIFRKYVL